MFVRSVLLYPKILSFKQNIVSFKLPSTDENNTNDDMNVDETKQDTFDIETDITHILNGFYTIKYMHVLIGYILKHDEPQILDANTLESFIMNENNLNKYPNLEKELACQLLPFLREVTVFLSAFNMFSDTNILDILWKSVPDNEDELSNISYEHKNNCNKDQIMNEFNEITSLLHLPSKVILHNDTYKYWIKNYLHNISAKELMYIKNEYGCDTIPFQLPSLPINFDEIFQRAGNQICPNKKVPPIESAICLLCGEYLCINCCRYDVKTYKLLPKNQSKYSDYNGIGNLTMHSKLCGKGMGIFLYIQKSSIILIYGHGASVYNSLYLDKYGEQDIGLHRGRLLKLNKIRLHELTQLCSNQNIPNKVCQLRGGKSSHYKKNWF